MAVASTLLTRSLDEAYRQAEAERVNRVALTVGAAWLLTRGDNGGGAGPAGWVEDAVQAILGGRRESHQHARAWNRLRRRVLVGRGDAPEMPRFVPDPEPIRRSLRFMGEVAPIRAFTRMGERAEELGREVTQADVDLLELNLLNMLRASAGRHVRDGGRDATREYVQRDARVTGFARVTRPGCCAFCAMLASLGPWYKSDNAFSRSDPRFALMSGSTRGGSHKVHDGCQCFLTPVYGRGDSQWTDLSRQYKDLWEEFGSRGGSPAERRRSFRREYERQFLRGDGSTMGESVRGEAS